MLSRILGDRMFGIGRQSGGLKQSNNMHRNAVKSTQNPEAILLDDNATPLIELREGVSGVIVKLVGGCGACSRLMGLGLHQGSPIKIVKKGNDGPILVEVGDTRVGLGRGICSHIIIDTSRSSKGSINTSKTPELRFVEILTTCECLDSGVRD